VVDRAGEHPAQLRSPHPRLQGGHLGRGLGEGRGVVLRGAELEENDRVVEVAAQLLDQGEALFEVGSSPVDRLRLLGVLPEVGSERPLLEIGDQRLDLREVKDAPLAP
jgi:hypothetical protein